MTKRVTLSYSVDLEDLNQEVSRLYNNASSCLRQLSNSSDRAEDFDYLTPATVRSIDEMRQSLTKIDTILNDVINIVSPYLEYVITTDQNNENEQPDSPSITDIERLRAIQETVTNALAASSSELSESQ